jgi:hypothetical protein
VRGHLDKLVGEAALVQGYRFVEAAVQPAVVFVGISSTGTRLCTGLTASQSVMTLTRPVPSVADPQKIGPV